MLQDNIDKKKKLQAEKQKRDTLLDEVRYETFRVCSTVNIFYSIE